MPQIPTFMDPEDFFRAGGALDADAPSYVVRQADADLWRAVQRGEYCNVLAARQMGKSSLKSRTAQRLREAGVRVVLIDLTSGGTSAETGAVEQWYYGLLTHIQRQLRLAVDMGSWWEVHKQLNPVQRFSDFVRYVMLEQIADPVVFFIDEIDSTLKLSFSDDFFAAVRALYNARADDPAYKRLTFVLLGVARPADLVKDRHRTPYNIGAAIDLHDFTLAEARALLPGLAEVYPAQAEKILTRILYWTDGHPYLTQRLCLDMAEAQLTEATASDSGDGIGRVDALVAQRFFAAGLRTEPNLQYIQDQITAYPQRGVLLHLYRKAYRGQMVADEVQSLDHNQLKLIGLVKTANGALRVRNAIYRQVFDLAWVKANTPVKRLQAVLAGAVLVILLLLIPLLDRAWVQMRLARYEKGFYETQIPEEQFFYLAGLTQELGVLKRKAYPGKVRELFYTLSPQQQAALFAELKTEDAENVVAVVEAVYVTLADVNASGHTTPLLEAIQACLARLERSDRVVRLQSELYDWLQGRKERRQDQTAALEAYNRALMVRETNPATLYERGAVWIEAGEYERALTDLDQVIALSADLYAEEMVFAKSDFATFEQIRSAVWQLGLTAPELAAALRDTQGTAYAQLWEYGAAEVILRGGKFTRSADGMVMLYVPGGEFHMGSTDGVSDEQPVHTVAVDAFWLDQTEVTNAQYQACVDAGSCTPSDCAGNINYNGDQQPVACVDWSQAAAYCEWAEVTLPTEAQWEYAARGPEGRIYPWGNEWRADVGVANCFELHCMENYEYSAPVGSFPEGASWVGALDMAGNAWEWTNDWYGAYSEARQENPMGPESGDLKVLRGGSWWHYYPSYLRNTFRGRLAASSRLEYVGFRCAAVNVQGE